MVIYMHVKYVDRILELAKFAYENGEVPVGAIIVKNGNIIGEGGNTRHECGSVIGHAEINAIEMACRNVGDWRLDDCVMYVTLIPCMMCTGALIESRIKKVYYLCNKTNVCFDASGYANFEEILDDYNRDNYIKLLQMFFENRRNKK